MSGHFEQGKTRRQLLAGILRYGSLGLFGAAGVAIFEKRRRLVRKGVCVGGGICRGCKALAECILPQARTVWQIDPDVCVACGNCANYCVLAESAVKCTHAFAVCGYCELCSGYFKPDAKELDTGAENQLCPTGAIKRAYVEDPYYEYVIDEPLCNGCGKCVKGCNAFGNGSLFLQVRHDRCINCNECSIAAACPSGAFKRVAAEQPYLLKETHA